MKSGFEKPNQKKETEQQGDFSEIKNKQESVELGTMEVGPQGEIEMRKDVSVDELLDMVGYESDAIERSLEDLYDMQDNEITVELEYTSIVEATHKEEFCNRIEALLEQQTSFDKKLDILDIQKKRFSATHEALEKVYNQVLDQRLAFKGVDDVFLDERIKKHLEARISGTQKLQKRILDIIEYLESKRAEVLVSGLRDGYVEEHNEDDDE